MDTDIENDSHITTTPHLLKIFHLVGFAQYLLPMFYNVDPPKELRDAISGPFESLAEFCWVSHSTP